MWKVCGAQYRKLTSGLLIPRIRSIAALPSSSKSSGCGSRTSRTPSASKTGSNSSSERQNCDSLRAACSGRPLNSEFITSTPRSAVIRIARFQYRTAACRSSSSGPDHLYSGSTDETPTPAAASSVLERGHPRVVHPRVVEERQEVVPRRELEPLVAQLGDEAGQLQQRDLPEHVRVEAELHPSTSLRRTISTSTGRPPAATARRPCRPRRRRTRPRPSGRRSRPSPRRSPSAGSRGRRRARTGPGSRPAPHHPSVPPPWSARRPRGRWRRCPAPPTASHRTS